MQHKLSRKVRARFPPHLDFVPPSIGGDYSHHREIWMINPGIKLELSKTTKISIFCELLGQTMTLVDFGTVNLFQSTILKKEKQIFTSECCQNLRHVVMTCCPTKKFGWLVIQHVIRYEMTLIPTQDSMAKNYNMSSRWQCCEKCHPCLDQPAKFG